MDGTEEWRYTKRHDGDTAGNHRNGGDGREIFSGRPRQW